MLSFVFRVLRSYIIQLLLWLSVKYDLGDLKVFLDISREVYECRHLAAFRR